MIVKKRKKLSAVHFLSLGYLITICIGTILLMMPFASKDGSTNIVDALLTATSATCVTGLVSFSTAAHWTIFGQVVILILIQIGGLGFMTIITLIFMLLKKNIGLYQRTILMQSAGSYSISGVVKLIKRILLGTFIFEGLGAIILTISFWGEYGAKAIYYGIFHSISAFCNAGFDIIGDSSLTAYANNWVVNLTIIALIIIGGLGFIVWSDIYDNKFNFKKYQLHTKIVLVFNGALILSSFILYFIFECTNIGQSGQLVNEVLSNKILCSLFMAVTPRTAGFNTISLNGLTSSSKLLTIILMFIGGSPGSTAGGVKVSTVIVVIANLVSQAKGKKHVVMFQRTISNGIIKQASSLVIAYLLMILTATIIICAIEPFPLEEILFEVVSAIGTVGLSIGVTASSTYATKIIIIFLMYAGRLGAFTLFSLFVKETNDLVLTKPEGKLLVG